MRLIAFLVVAGLLSLTSVRTSLAGEPNDQAVPLSPALRERCLETLRRGVKSDEFWPAMHAAEALTLAGAGSEVLALLRERLSHEDNDQRRCGLARELVRAGDHSRLPLLFEILSNPASNGRVHAAESLSKLGESGDGQALRVALEAKNPQLRLMAAAALARAGQADALAVLRDALRSDDRAMRSTAAFALSRVGGPADIEPLLVLFERERDPESRSLLAAALARLGNTTGRDQLISNLDSPLASVRTVSAEYAGHCRCQSAGPKLVALLDDRVLDVRVRAAQSIVALSLPAPKR
jgi:sialidase-1